MKDMKDENEFGYKTRQLLNHGSETLDEKVVERLCAARRAALDHQRAPVSGLRLAGFAHIFDASFSTRTRGLLALLALAIGASGTYFWNEYQTASEYEEIDSALLADELPPSAYLDRGFHAWLERHNSHSSSQ